MPHPFDPVSSAAQLHLRFKRNKTLDINRPEKDAALATVLEMVAGQLDDADLRAAFQRSGDEVGDPEGDTLAGVMWRRGLSL